MQVYSLEVRTEHNLPHCDTEYKWLKVGVFLTKREATVYALDHLRLYLSHQGESWRVCEWDSWKITRDNAL